MIENNDMDKLEAIINRMTGIEKQVFDESRQTSSFVQLIEAFKDHWHCDDDVVLRSIGYWLFHISLDITKSNNEKVDYIK